MFCKITITLEILGEKNKKMQVSGGWARDTVYRVVT